MQERQHASQIAARPKVVIKVRLPMPGTLRGRHLTGSEWHPVAFSFRYGFPYWRPYNEKDHPLRWSKSLFLLVGDARIELATPAV
jgi:hypothetical protein